MKKILFFMMLAMIAVFSVFRVADAQADQVSLKMVSSNATIDGFRVFMRRQGQRYDFSRPVWAGKSGICTIGDLEPGVTYYFVARVFKGDEQSPNSNEVEYTAVDRRPAPDLPTHK